MFKFIIPLTVLAIFLIFKSVSSQPPPVPYCLCPNGNPRPYCVPSPLNQREARQRPESIPQCYCDGPFVPTCDSLLQKQANATADVGCICNEIFQPVCGLDTKTNMVKTYGNSCELACAQRTNPNLIKAFDGECKNGCTAYTGPGKPPGEDVSGNRTNSSA